jgi:predicted  nucleic acid-binding Zn-ribbon protein
MKRIFDNYTITKDGRIFRNSDNKEMSGCVDSCGYKKFSPRFDGEKVQAKVHRLVAMLYIPNPNNLPQVNHKDGNKLNNNFENLEWCDSKHNIRHAHKTGLSDNKHLKKKVKQINPLTNKVIAVYDSYREASIKVGISEQSISQICRQYKPTNRPHPRQTAGGFKWETCND